LLELSFNAPPFDWEYLISDIKRLGYHIIIAHPERYPYVAKNIGFVQSLISYGCELQIDASSLCAKRFSSVRRAALSMLDRDLVSYIASDAHKASDFEMFASVYRGFKKCWPNDGLLNNHI